MDSKVRSGERWVLVLSLAEEKQNLIITENSLHLLS